MNKLSIRSLQHLEGVKPQLINVVKLAITLTKTDFGVTEGLRSREKQENLVKEGKSRTFNSRHLTGDAVDLVAYIDGKVSWETAPYYNLARAMQEAGIKLKVNIIWGGIWDTPLNMLSSNLEKEVIDYHQRFKQKNPNRKPFFDGPHFELPRRVSI